MEGERDGGSKVRGRKNSYLNFHLWKALYIYYRENRIGRKVLARHLGVGEGVAKSIIQRLKSRGFVKIGYGGTEITPKGRDKISPYIISEKTITARPLALGERHVLIQVRNLSVNVTDGMKERDEAIKIGALGATTLIFKNRKLILPPSLVVDDVYPEIAKRIRTLSNLREGDVLILGSGKDYKTAENGALASTFSLMKTARP